MVFRLVWYAVSVEGPPERVPGGPCVSGVLQSGASGGREGDDRAVDDDAAGSDAAICAAAELSAGTVSESKVWKFSGLVMSTTTLPTSWSPRVARMSAMAAWGTASTTMSPVTGLPVSEWPSSSTVLPPLVTRPEMPWLMLPVPMMLTCVMEMLFGAWCYGL